MYKIYADETLIYDSTIEDYKIGKGSISLETNKSGSFTFSVYPDHFFYDSFVKLKTVITVYKSGKIVFRGRILNDVVDYWNNKVITCEGELGFLQDSIIRPFSFSGTPEELFTKFVQDHNSQVDEFKRFKIGRVTVLDSNDYIARSNSDYESALSNMNSRLIEDSLGGYIHITHGEDGTDPIPTIHYLSDFTTVASQVIQFGSNLKDYTKTVKSEDIATAIIPLGAEGVYVEGERITIANVNNGVDYVYDETAVSLYGWIFKVVEWDDVTREDNLKAKAEAYLTELVKQNVTIELNAIDLHLLDHSIESFKVGDYVRVISEPHNFTDTLLCQSQTIDLLRPENDTIVLGQAYSTFTGSNVKTITNVIKSVGNVKNNVVNVKNDIANLNDKTNRYQMAEQQLTALMSQSFGVFTSSEALEDGSTISYIHDKPTLEESTNIWKMTGSAFAVSNDGGKTWSAGLDASGNAVFNVLSVIGIDAGWLNADSLTAMTAKLGGWTITEGEIIQEEVVPEEGKYSGDYVNLSCNGLYVSSPSIYSEYSKAKTIVMPGQISVSDHQRNLVLMGTSVTINTHNFRTSVAMYRDENEIGHVVATGDYQIRDNKGNTIARFGNTTVHGETYTVLEADQVLPGNGWSGHFVAVDGKTVFVSCGIITEVRDSTTGEVIP